MTARAVAAQAAPSKFFPTAVRCPALPSARTAAMPVMLGLTPPPEHSLGTVMVLAAGEAAVLFLLPQPQPGSALRAEATASRIPRKILMALLPGSPAFP